MNYKKFTKDEINKLPEEDLSRLIWVTNDGQGDTSVWELYEMMGWYAEDEHEFETTSDFINLIWQDTNGNMSELFWVENNKLMKIKYVNW